MVTVSDAWWSRCLIHAGGRPNNAGTMWNPSPAHSPAAQQHTPPGRQQHERERRATSLAQVFSQFVCGVREVELMALSKARRVSSSTEEQWTPMRNLGLLRSIGADDHGGTYRYVMAHIAIS